MKNPENNNKDTIWLACGENCMPIDILRRHGRNAPSTPYSSGRSDIEHLSHFESTEYRDLLKNDYIIKANALTGECYLNIAKKSSGLCRPGRHQYLEFTHHNPDNEKDLKALQRRTDRMLTLRKINRPITFFYHHRSSTGFEETKSMIKKRFIGILDYYTNATALCYSQQIIEKEKQKGFDFLKTFGGKVNFCTLKTQNVWGGNNLNHFFGRNEDQILKRIFLGVLHL